jgi:hypothetical protein
MARLNNQWETPPDGWVYTQLETQTRIELQPNGSLPELVNLVVEHRRWKGLHPQDHASVRLDVERQICASMPPGVCQGEAGEVYEPLNDQSRVLNLDKIQSFSRGLLEWVRTGAQMVAEEIGLARGDVCRGCPFNKTPKSCSCAPLWLLLASIIPSHRRQHNLHICGICGCTLEAKVLAPADVLRETERGLNHRYPPHCWMREIING